jgi:hypothetical protein
MSCMNFGADVEEFSALTDITYVLVVITRD